MPGMSHMSDEVILKEPDNKPVTLAPAKPKHKKVVAKKPQPAKTKAPEVSTEVKEIEVENKEPIKVITPSTTEDKISIPSEPVENKEMAEAHEEATSTVTTTEDKAVITSYSIHYTKLYESSGDSGFPSLFLSSKTSSASSKATIISKRFSLICPIAEVSSLPFSSIYSPNLRIWSSCPC